MQPDKGAFRPRNATFTTALGQTLPVFLAALESAAQENRSERSCRRGQQPIDPQTGRQFAAQGPLLPILSAISYARLVTRLSSLSTRWRAVSSASRSASGGTKMGSPATTPIRPNGRLTVVRSQLSNSTRRLEAIATA